MTHRHDPSTTKIDSLLRNCTLVAVREVTGKSDEEILRAFLARGYEWNRGTRMDQYEGATNDLGFKTKRVSVWKTENDSPEFSEKYKTVDTGRVSMWGHRIVMTIRQTLTVGSFGRRYKKGTFVVSDGGHAFVIRDGVVVDTNLESRGQMRRRKLVAAFEVINPAPSRKLVATRLKRNSDPVVKFSPLGKTKQVRQVERDARRVAWELATNEQLPGVRLSQITSRTGYTRYDAAWDVRRGRLIIVKP